MYLVDTLFVIFTLNNEFRISHSCKKTSSFHIIVGAITLSRYKQFVQ